MGHYQVRLHTNLEGSTTILIGGVGPSGSKQGSSHSLKSEG